MTNPLRAVTAEERASKVIKEWLYCAEPLTASHHIEALTSEIAIQIQQAVDDAITEDRKIHNNRTEEVVKEIRAEGFRDGYAQGYAECRELAAQVAENHYRGYSEIGRETASAIRALRPKEQK